MFLHLDNIQGGLTVGDLYFFLALYQLKNLFVFETITVGVYPFFYHLLLVFYTKTVEEPIRF